jgi:diaminohydroxyphosphoribosylaminopyrimidine deaminase/5-amino-6-(5-phosphoribosylamino)uracil reductase
MAASDQIFMEAALALARAQLGRTAPNPTVGCVIVRDGAVIAAAATGAGGRPHAEEQALAQLPSAAGATVYVTMEPCNQRSAGGRSCTDLLLAAAPARVVIACLDPHPLANGAGIARLKAAGIVVDVRPSAEAAALNADFFATLGET